MKVPSFGPLEESACGLCGEAQWTLVTRQRVFGEDFQIVRCNSCHLIRTNPRPSAAWKRSFYDPRCNGYAESLGRDYVYAPDPGRLIGYRRIVSFLKANSLPGAKLLDVGCAAGLFVQEANRGGFDSEGCDYSDNAVRQAHAATGIRAFVSAAEKVEVPEDQYDVVTLLQVFEHLPHPMPVLAELRRILKPGGMLVLETVNYSPHYWIEKHFKFLIPVYGSLTKRPCLPWLPFDHLYHWSPPTMLRALRDSGFNDVKLNHLTGYRSEAKTSRTFTAVYAGCEFIGSSIRVASRGRLDFWPVLLATARK